MRTKLAASLVAMLAVMMVGVGGSVASARQAQAKTEHLRFMSTAATSRRISVIATGTFTAGGIDRPGRETDVLRFPTGTLRYRHVTRTFSASFNPQTCLLTEALTGRFTLGHGTGRFAGVRGSGRFTFNIVGVTTKNRAGHCTHVQAPATFQQVATAKGTITG